MPTYQYQTRAAGGQVTAGTMAATDLNTAANTLRQKGLAIVSLRPLPKGKAGGGMSLKDIGNISISLGPGAKDVQNFTSQLAVMVRAGISLRAAVDGIADQTENPKFKVMLVQIKDDLDGGRSFSEALQRYPKTFSPLYINMVKASELSGGFAKMLDRIAAYQAQQIETMSQVRGAMIYPGIIGTLAVGVTVFLLTFVLPRFTSIFAGKEAALPLPTRMLLVVSNSMTAYWYVYLGAIVVAAWVFFMGIRTKPGRRWFDKAKLTVPLFKKLFRALYISRSLHTMGQLINAGVPMLDTIAITAEISGNVFYRDMWRKVYSAVKEGKKISIPLHQSTLLPKSVIQMVSAGEESGKLGEVLSEVSEFYGRELRNVIKSVTAMIEPLMIVVMGSVVGFIAMSVILPIFKLSTLVQ